jgi:hypothetical protein
MKKLILITLLIILIGAIGVSAYLLKGMGRQVGKVPTPTQPTSPPQTEIDTSNWKVYRNEEYGFEIRYPTDFIAETDINLGIMRGGIIKFRLVNNKYYQATNLEEASVVIGARKDKEDLENCLKPEAGRSRYKELLKEKVINGITFYKDFVEEGAAGQGYEKVSYRALYKDTCYEVALFIHATRVSDRRPTVSPFAKDEVLKKLNEIFATFRFIEI